MGSLTMVMQQQVGGEEGAGTKDNDLVEVELWDGFWTLFPRHEAKKDARKAWDKLAEGEQLAAVVAIADWRRVWAAQGRDSSVTPLPGTWLRGERWEDELPLGFRRSSATVTALPTAASPKRGEIPDHVKRMIARLKEGR